MSHRTARVRAALLATALIATGLCSATVGVSPSEAAVDREAYIAKAAEAAKASKKKYGVPRAVTIAQSILESGWGKSGLTTKYHNYFGMKCGAVVSPYQKGCVALSSYEYVGGKKKKYVSRFRVYSSMEKSFLDHGRLLNYADRYNPAFKYPNDPDKFIRAVHKAGYATDPNYATSVINTMRQWNLYRFDVAPKPSPKPKPTPKPKPKPDPNKKLIGTLAPLAQRSEAASGVPSSVTIAQALHHSKSGTSAVAKKANNYFALTCSGAKSKLSSGCVTISGKKYRKYKSVASSVADQAAVLSGARYRAAMRSAGNPKAFLAAVAKAGWSSSKSYAGTVYGLVTKYGLTKYDLLISTTLKQGNRNAKVTALQNLLVKAGGTVKTTGYFGTDTVAAVKAYQKKRKLPVTGKADPLTLTRLTPDVRKGAHGAAVAALNGLLKARSYPVDAGSNFGAKTLTSVKALQKKTKLPQTGIVSTRTWAVLFG
ncbi:MAG: glucosaminidase domain-containing protein [Micropruina sp.]|uniref:glucosaminidase domain-containing protein n=1 Tax=Micropruina sp. TaxID=2737536 RepID=UPI0039E60C49